MVEAAREVEETSQALRETIEKCTGTIKKHTDTFKKHIDTIKTKTDTIDVLQRELHEARESARAANLLQAEQTGTITKHADKILEIAKACKMRKRATCQAEKTHKSRKVELNKQKEISQELLNALKVIRKATNFCATPEEVKQKGTEPDVKEDSDDEILDSKTLVKLPE